MSKFLTYSEIDTAIQRRMANQAPDSERRRMAINDVLNHIYTQYDIKTAKREVVLYAVPDGEAIYLENSVVDFKNPKDLRYLAKEKSSVEFVYREEDEFIRNINAGRRLNEFTTYYRDGNLLLAVNTSESLTYKTLHSMNSISDNGTWSVGDDADGLTTTEVKVLEQSESIKFDIDVSKSSKHSAYIVNSSLTPVDLGDYVELGRIKFKIYLPSVTNLTNIELRWGSDASNYWYATTNKQTNQTSLIAGWNSVEFDWANATQQGTVDNQNIDYLMVKLNYSSSFVDQEGVVIEAIKCYLPIPFKMVYFTNYVSRDENGVMQEEMSGDNNDEELLLPKKWKELVVVKCLLWLAPMALGDDANNFITYWSAKEREELKKLGLTEGIKPKVTERKVKLRSKLY